MSKKNDQIGMQLGITLIIALVLLVVWEFWLQNLIVGTLLSQETSKSSFDRWEFVVACLVIIGVSLILPFKRVKQVMGELKSVEQALRGEKTLSKVFFSVDNSIILVVDTGNQIMQINQKASNILGYKEEEVLGKDWIQFLIKGKEKDSFRKEFLGFVADRTKQFTSFSIAVQGKDKKDKAVEWQAAPLMDERGQVYGTIISGQDISRQQMLDNQLAAIKNKYEPQLQKLSKELNENKKKYHNEAIKTAHAKARFRYWFELEKTLIALPPQETGNKQEVDRRIKKALEDYGELCGVDHGFVFLFSEDKETMTNTHLWVSDEPLMEPDADITPLSQVPWPKEKIFNKEVLHIPKITELPDTAQSEKKMFAAQGIQSILLAPLVINGSPMGYVGFETIQADKTWDNDEISILKIIARLITHALSPGQNGSTSGPAAQESMDVDLDIEMDEGISLEPEEPSLEQDLQETKANIEQELKQRIAEMEKNRSDLEAQIQNSEKLEYQLRAAQKEMESQLSAKTQELEKSKAALDSEKQSKQKLEEQLRTGSGNLEKQLAEKNEFIQKIQNQLDSEIKAKESLEEQMSTSQETLEKELAEKNEELDKLRKSLEEEKKSKEELEEQIKDQPKTAHATNLEKQLSKKSQELQKVQAQLENELETKKKLEEQFKRDSTLLEKKVGEKEKEIEELQSLIEEAGKIAGPAGTQETKPEKPGEAKKEEAPPELTQELEQIRADLEEKNGELESLQLELEDFKSHAVTPEELQEIKTQIEDRDHEIESLYTQLEEEKVAKNWVESELGQLQKDLEKQKEDFEVLDTARSMLQAEIDEMKKLEEEYEKIQNDYQNVQQEYENIQMDFQDAQQENENLEIANQQMMNDLEDKNSTIQYLEAQAHRIETVDLPIFTMNIQGTIMSWNKGAQKLTGYIMEAAQGQPLSFLFPKDEDLSLQENVLIPLQEKGSVTLILPLALAMDDGKKGLISLSLFKNGEDSDEAIGIIADLSDDKKAEEALEHLKVYYDSIMKKSGLIPVTLTTDYKIAEIGPEAETLLGWKPDSIADQDFFETVMPGEDWKSVASQASESLDADTTYNFESNTPVNGSEKHAMIWNLIKESKGEDEPPTILAVGQDINEVRQRENSIKEREALLRSMIDTAVDGFITIDESGIIQSFNSTSEDIFGYSSSEVEGHKINMLMPEPYRSEHDNYIARYLSTGKGNLVNKDPREFIAQHKDGSTFPIELAVREIYHGYRRLFVGIIHDIRKRKQFEISAKENEDKFRKLMESELDGVLIVNLADNRIMDSNEASEKIFGYSKEELANLSMTDLSANGSGDGLTAQSGALGLGPKTRSRTLHFNRKDGTLFPAQVVTSSFIIRNEKLGLHIIRDVSQQIKADELLRENDKHLQDILNQASQPIYLKDVEGRFTLVNTRFQELFHVTQEKVLNKTDHDVFPKDLAETLSSTDRQALETGQPMESRDTILHDDGIHTYVTSKYPLRNSAGVLYGICGVLTDVTTRLRLEEDLTQLQNSVQDKVDDRAKELEAQQEKQVLKARMQAAGKVMAALAQQISNPVHGIENILDQLNQRVAMEEIHKGLMTVALSECRRVADLADQLEASQIPDLGEPEKVTLHALIDDTIKKQELELKAKNIKMEKHYATNISDIQGNPTQIGMALEHLLRNAEEALTDPNGTITLTTEKVGDRVKIHVQDDGCGIPGEFLEKIFDPFFTTKKAEHRAGLGLMTVIGVAQAHGGDIDVKSQPGKGTTFTLTLPLVP